MKYDKLRLFLHRETKYIIFLHHFDICNGALSVSCIIADGRW